MPDPSSLPPGVDARDLRFLARALELARASAAADGGPFGALIARGDEILALGTNRVTAGHDPTAHAEVVAIRAACARLGTHQLEGCTLYSSCEPCPMCLGAIYWARPERVLFAATRREAAEAGFDDALIYAEIVREPADRRIPFLAVNHPDSAAVWDAWQANAQRIRY